MARGENHNTVTLLLTHWSDGTLALVQRCALRLPYHCLHACRPDFRLCYKCRYNYFNDWGVTLLKYLIYPLRNKCVCRLSTAANLSKTDRHSWHHTIYLCACGHVCVFVCVVDIWNSNFVQATKLIVESMGTFLRHKRQWNPIPSDSSRLFLLF